MNDLKNKIAFVIVGRSGCGKGTQARFIMERLSSLGARHLETGKFLREALKNNNVTAEIGNKMMREGGLFPAWFAAFTWLKEIIERGAAADNLIFDGTPRRVWESDLLDKVMEWHQRPKPVCVYIDVSREESFRRLTLRKRADDTPEAINKRLDFFDTDVWPVVEYYQKEQRSITVNGEQEVLKVWQELDKKLGEFLKKSWPLK